MAEVLAGNETVAGAILACTGREGKQLVSQVFSSFLLVITLNLDARLYTTLGGSTVVLFSLLPPASWPIYIGALHLEFGNF